MGRSSLCLITLLIDWSLCFLCFHEITLMLNWISARSWLQKMLNCLEPGGLFELTAAGPLDKTGLIQLACFGNYAMAAVNVVTGMSDVTLELNRLFNRT